MSSDPIEAQKEKDREELTKFLSGANKPLSWCIEHDCKLGTCFPEHYPESLSSTNTLRYVDEDVPKVVVSDEFKEHVQEKLSEDLDARVWSEEKPKQELWKELWRRLPSWHKGA